MAGAKSTYYIEKYNYIASDIRKLCRIYNAEYADLVTENLVNNHKYTASEDPLIAKSFQLLCDKFLYAGRWTDREMMMQMWKDFVVLHKQACDDKRCALNNSRIETGYTATHGMLQLLMSLADTPTKGGKAVYVSDDFICLENLSLLIPKRKEFIDNSEFKVSSEYLSEWMLEYEEDKAIQSDEDDEFHLSSSVARYRRSIGLFDDNKETSPLESANAKALENRDSSLYFKFGNALSVYRPLPVSVSFAIDGSVNIHNTELVHKAAPELSNALYCSEMDCVKMILEMLLGCENELYWMVSEDKQTPRVQVTQLATRVRLASRSLSPTVLRSLLDWFSALGSAVATARDFTSTFPLLAKHEYRGLQETLQAQILKYLDSFHRQISAMETILFSPALHDTLTLLQTYLRLQPWHKLFQCLAAIIHTTQTLFTTSGELFTQTDENRKKFLDNGVLDELLAGMEVFSLNAIDPTLAGTIQAAQASSAYKASAFHNLELSLPFSEKSDVLKDFYADAFFGSISVYLEAFMNSLWTGVLHKKLKEDAVVKEEEAEVSAEAAKTAADIEKEARASRFRDIKNSFQRVDSSAEAAKSAAIQSITKELSPREQGRFHMLFILLCCALRLVSCSDEECDDSGSQVPPRAHCAGGVIRH